jgi:hypothetical protein
MIIPDQALILLFHTQTEPSAFSRDEAAPRYHAKRPRQTEPMIKKQQNPICCLCFVSSRSLAIPQRSYSTKMNSNTFFLPSLSTAAVNLLSSGFEYFAGISLWIGST